MARIIFILIMVFGIQCAAAQSEEALITKTLMDYIEGTANGEPDRIRKAFHSDLNLYSIANDTLRALSGKQYIGYFKEGQKADRVGKIISIDYVNDAAIAKVEIKSPGRKRLYTDYMMLLKIKGQWMIIHKSFTSQSYN